VRATPFVVAQLELQARDEAVFQAQLRAHAVDGVVRGAQASGELCLELGVARHGNGHWRADLGRGGRGGHGRGAAQGGQRALALVQAEAQPRDLTRERAQAAFEGRAFGQVARCGELQRERRDALRQVRLAALELGDVLAHLVRQGHRLTLGAAGANELELEALAQLADLGLQAALTLARIRGVRFGQSQQRAGTLVQLAHLGDASAQATHAPQQLGLHQLERGGSLVGGAVQRDAQGVVLEARGVQLGSQLGVLERRGQVRRALHHGERGQQR
jgi:hypothetical protein